MVNRAVSNIYSLNRMFQVMIIFETFMSVLAFKRFNKIRPIPIDND